jgi:hypothetical protein
MQKRSEPRQPIRRRGDHCSDAHRTHPADQPKVRPRRPGHEVHRERRRGDHQKRPEVRLQQHEHRHRAKRHDERHEPTLPRTRVLRAVAPGEPTGDVRHERQLGEFRRLKGKSPDADPAMRRAPRGSDAGDEHQHQQTERNHQQMRGVPLPHMVIETRAHQKKKDARQQPIHRLVPHEPPAVSELLKGERPGRRGQHHEAERHDEGEQPKKYVVGVVDGGSMHGEHSSAHFKIPKSTIAMTRPMIAPTPDTIQKRITTFSSGQPLASK